MQVLNNSNFSSLNESFQNILSNNLSISPTSQTHCEDDLIDKIMDVFNQCYGGHIKQMCTKILIIIISIQLLFLSLHYL